jgi:hypothetical protein
MPFPFFALTAAGLPVPVKDFLFSRLGPREQKNEVSNGRHH